MKQLKYLLITLLFCPSMFVHAQEMDKLWGEQGTAKTEKTGSTGAQMFSDGNYAMFIHWGLSSYLGGKWKGKTYYGISEWLMNPNMAGIPADEYMKEAVNFDPEKFDAKAIVNLAKAAGMKYIIITSKHHDGFAMYHSKADKFNIVDATPFKHDPMKELAEACKKAGLGFGFYYSQTQDWTAPGGFRGPDHDANGNPVSFDEYFEKKCLPQVNEITTEYGDMVLIWFDTPGNISEQQVRELIALVRKNQPNALVSGRVGHGLGDYQTFGDMEIPMENVPGMWETVDVTNDSWGYAWYDNNWKTPKTIVENVISTVARGGTYMLNIGLKGDGAIPEEAEYILQESGKWIEKYPQVIYGADASPWKHRLAWGDVTRKDNKLFLAVYQWPENGKLYLPGLQTPVTEARLLTGDKSKKLKFSAENGWIVFEVPFERPEKMVSVIELTCTGEPVADETLAIDPEVPLTISTHFANTENCSKQKKSWMEKFGEWKHIMQVNRWNENSGVSWEINFHSTGYYQVELNYTGTKQVVWKVFGDEGRFVQNQQSTSSVYTWHPMGWLKIDKPGKHTITVSLLGGDFSNTSLQSAQFSKID